MKSSLRETASVCNGDSGSPRAKERGWREQNSETLQTQFKHSYFPSSPINRSMYHLQTKNFPALWKRLNTSLLFDCSVVQLFLDFSPSHINTRACQRDPMVHTSLTFDCFWGKIASLASSPQHVCGRVSATGCTYGGLLLQIISVAWKYLLWNASCCIFYWTEVFMLFERLQIPHQLGHLTLNACFLFLRVLEELKF